MVDNSASRCYIVSMHHPQTLANGDPLMSRRRQYWQKIVRQIGKEKALTCLRPNVTAVKAERISRFVNNLRELPPDGSRKSHQ
jgi:hypothetical protein